MPKKTKYKGAKRGAKRIYPWDKWMAHTGKWVHLVQGKHFSCKQSTMAVLIRGMAKKMNHEIHVFKLPDNKIKFIVGELPE